MKLLIFGGRLYPLNMGRVKGVGVLEFVGGLMGVVCGVVLVKGGRASLRIFLFLWVMVLESSSGMIDGLRLIPIKSSTLSSM